ncbi:MAG TPA: AraC family transcriptional regulator ligand-binding domain-containing protein [Polyangiaceae bacterium]|jgi:AraC-like DNA-binding protein|nr:AraC family transcriptional regulator ligand-binding domain-containing protein [Polyangiaceae bacterium]
MADLVPIPLALFDRLARAVDVDKVLRRAKLPRSRFRTAKPQGTTAEFFALWRAVEQNGADADLGLRLGVEALSDYEDVAIVAALHSATLGEGLHKLARYKRLACPERVWIDVEDGEARLRFEWLLAEEDPPTLVTDLLFAFLLGLAQRGTAKPVRPKRIELTRRRANEAILGKHFRCELRFDSPHDVMVFDEASLALPMINCDTQLLSVLLPELELAVAKDRHAGTLVDDIRSALNETMCGCRPAIANVARSLGMSARTMQRRLGELGTTYQDVLDDVRRRSARRLLANTDLGTGEIAFVLGFEEVNSFVRAFQAWEKTTPAKWRESQPPPRRVAKTATLRRGSPARAETAAHQVTDFRGLTARIGR